MPAIIRRTFPKKTNFDNISDSQVQGTEKKINTRPMKCLDFKTPFKGHALFGLFTSKI